MLVFTDTPGAIFNAWGRLGKIIVQMASYQASQLGNLKDNADNAIVQFEGEPDIQATLGAAYIDMLNAPGGIAGTLQTCASTYLNREVYRDTPRIAQNLTQINLLDSIQEMVYQMEQQGASVLAMTITTTVTPFTNNVQNTGNGAIVVSTKRPIDGRTLERCFSENLQILCTSDSYIGGSTEGNEGFTVTGEGDESDVFAFDWPLGSNSTQGYNCVDGSVSEGSGNFLSNSGYDAFTSNTPDDFTITVGTAGTQIFAETSLVFGSGKALRLLGDGTTLTAWTQEFDSATGTSQTLEPLTQYSYNVWVRRDGTAPAAGQLAVELIDGGGAIVQDAAGNNNQFTIDLTGLTVFYAPYGGSFRTPHVMPDTLKIRFRLTTGNALTSGRSVYFDRGGLGLSVQQYVGGPYLTLFSGSSPFVQGDFTLVGISNSFGSGGTLNTFQILVGRLISEFTTNDILIPSSATPTISDALITR